jgi:hypothetical protein
LEAIAATVGLGTEQLARLAVAAIDSVCHIGFERGVRVVSFGKFVVDDEFVPRLRVVRAESETA